MINIILSVSKYMLLICMALYTISAFGVLKGNNEEKHNRRNINQIILLFLIHFIGYLVIFLNVQDDKVILFYAAQVIYFIIVIGIYPIFYSKLNKPLLNNMCLLLAISFIILARLDYVKCMKQFQIVAVATIITMFIPWMISKFRWLENLKWFYCIVGVLLLAVVLFTALSTNGAKLSLNLGFISIQPSEFVKIIFVFFMASLLAKKSDFKTVVITTIFAAIFVIILVMSTDLGSALIFFLVYLFMVYVATKNSWYIMAGFGAGCIASFLAFKLFPHVQVRVNMWLNPWADIDGKGYQIIQSLFAIGTGSWFGTGLYEGMPNQIPIVEKDLIFAAISEEMGGFVAVSIILICLCCFMIFIQIAMQQKNNFYKLIAVGLGTVYTFQVFLTVGGTMKLIPLTGVTLPLVSYGGSSILSTLIMFAVIQGLSVIENKDVKG